jgi:hypothetical protein
VYISRFQEPPETSLSLDGPADIENVVSFFSVPDKMDYSSGEKCKKQTAPELQ